MSVFYDCKTLEDAKQVFREEAKLCHPDKNPKLKNAKEIFQDLLEEYESTVRRLRLQGGLTESEPFTSFCPNLSLEDEGLVNLEQEYELGVNFIGIMVGLFTDNGSHQWVIQVSPEQKYALKKRSSRGRIRLKLREIYELQNTYAVKNQLIKGEA